MAATVLKGRGAVRGYNESGVASSKGEDKVERPKLRGVGARFTKPHGVGRVHRTE